MDVGAALRELDARLLACVVEQAQLDAVRHVGEDGEVRTGTVVGRPERIGTTGPDVLTLGGHAAPCWRPADELLGDGFTLSAARAQPCREPGEAPFQCRASDPRNRETHPAGTLLPQVRWSQSGAGNRTAATPAHPTPGCSRSPCPTCSPRSPTSRPRPAGEPVRPPPSGRAFAPCAHAGRAFALRAAPRAASAPP